MTNQGMIEILEKENTFLRGEAEEWRIKFQHSEDTIALLEKQIKEVLAPGENNQKVSGRNRHFQSNKNSQL